jgi:YesN/AraC family two-component response regulator
MFGMDYLMGPGQTGDWPPIPPRPGMAGVSQPEVEKRTILVVDDEPATLEMYARMLRVQPASFNTLKARDGRQALDVLKQNRVDLVLLDLRMPELDGFGVLEAMRQSAATKDIPVIVLTAQVLTESDMTRLNRGVASVLEKGLFSIDEMLQHVDAALARSREVGSEGQQLIRKAMAYIHLHYAEDISVESVARYIQIGEDFLQRCFQQETGVTLLTYLDRYRVNEAKTLLAATELSIAEVAQKVGFADSKYFSQVFRREVGMPPSAYRRQAGGKSTE